MNLELDTTIGGATSDDAPRIVSLGNREVTIYQAARNKLLRDDGKFKSATLYYACQPTLRRLADNKIDVRAFHSLSKPSTSIIQFTLMPADIDRSQLHRAIKSEGIDPFVQLPNVLPIQIYGLRVSVLDSSPVHIPLESAPPFNQPLAIDIPVDAANASAIADAIQNGATITVEYDRLVKLSQIAETSIKWSEVRKTKTFRDYNGPSSATMITAAQVLDFAQSTLSELKVFHWEELDARDSGGVSTNDYRSHLNAIIDRFLTSREAKQMDLREWVNTHRFDVPVTDYQKLIDTVNQVAYDAKNLNNNEWCRKYSDQLKTLSKSSNARNSPASFGFELGIPGIIEGSLDAKESTTSSSSENLYEKALSTEDCGKKLVEDNYHYGFNGTKYIPKSIKVFERNMAGGEIADSEEFITYQIRQKLGRNTWRFSAND